jgi:hypothetical protein
VVVVSITVEALCNNPDGVDGCAGRPAGGMR